jgi:hypothetical protein
VRDEHNRDAALMVELLEEAHNFDRSTSVQIPRWLIGEQQGRIIHQRPRDGDALLLSARQLIWVMVLARGETHERQRLAAALQPLPSRHVRIQERQLHVFDRTGACEQVEALKYETDLPVANVRSVVF